MRSLPDLLADPAGVAFLEEHGTYVDSSAFAAALRPPESDGLTSLLGLEADCRPVYVGQQVCADMRAATAAKFEAARAVADRHGVTPVLLWHDMDSTETERYGARLVLPSRKRERGVWLISRELEDHEPRFIPIDRERLQTVIDDVASWLRGSGVVDKRDAKARMEQLAAALLDEEIATLADANRAIATLLLREELAFVAPTAYASEMVAQGLLIDSVVEYIAAVDDVVRVFNESIDRLVADEIDPQVRPLRSDYLPVRFSCPLEGTRLRLSRELRGETVMATATCRCGTHYEFDLGVGGTGLGELGATGRWSIDVSMPVHHNDLASGWVAGRSGALYGLVFNEVLERVFGRRPIPALVPGELADQADGSTLLVRWLTAGRVGEFATT